MTEAEKRTQARIPAPVHQWLAERAKANDRSMNAELVRILKEAMAKESNMNDNQNTKPKQQLEALEMAFDQAVEIYTAAIEAKTNGMGQALYPSESCSYLKNGVWYLHNHYQFLGKVGTKCQCLIGMEA